MSDLFDAMRNQRAHRAFTHEPVRDELVARLLDAATRAPSAMNSQPWVFVVVRDDATRAAISAVMNRAWDTGGRSYAVERLASAEFAGVDAGATGGIGDAPVLIVVGGDTRRCPRAALAASIYPAVQNLLLAAQALGLGAALTTLATALAEDLRASVAFPTHIEPMAVIPVGIPTRGLAPGNREPFGQHTARDRYGAPW